MRGGLMKIVSCETGSWIDENYCLRWNGIWIDEQNSLHK